MMSLVETSQVLGNLGEFVGSIAILATLAYLAIQIRQAGRATTLAAVQATRTERILWFQSSRDSPYMPAIFSKMDAGGALDEEESYRLRSHNAALWSSVYSQWIQQELGFAGRFATKDVGMVGMAISTHGGKDWWEANANLIYPDEFCRYIDAAVPTLDLVNFDSYIK
jgi:hypothetical protein